MTHCAQKRNFADQCSSPFFFFYCFLYENDFPGGLVVRHVLLFKGQSSHILLLACFLFIRLASFHRRLSFPLPCHYPDEFNHRQPVSELKLI